MNDDLAMARQLSCSINKGLYKKARLQGLAYLKGKPYEIVEAELGFQVALACSLDKDTRSLPWSELERFLGFTDRMATDTVRDQALEAIRRRDFDASRELVRVARGFSIEDDDNNRRIVMVYVEGRQYAAQGKNIMALTMYDEALGAWSHIADPNEQWVRNCRFHRLHVLARLNGPGRWRETAVFAKAEPSRKKRIAAWMLALTGGLPGIDPNSKSSTKWL